MPAVSKQQRKFMGLVHAVQQGKVPASKVSKSARDAAKQMKKKDVEDFADTKEKGLPTKKRNVIEKGILKGWLLDLASSRQLDLKPTGNARRGIGGPASPGTSNFMISPSNISPIELRNDKYKLQNKGVI